MNNHHKTGEDKAPLKDSLDEISQDEDLSKFIL